MKRILSILGGIIVLALLWFCFWDTGSPPSNTIDYHGQTIQLSKPYTSYEDYEEDPNNIAPSETARVQELVKSAAVAKQFADRKQMIDGINDIRFPGYGLTASSETPQSDGTVLALSAVEIPRSGNSRFLLFQGKSGSYTLIDDFVYSDSAVIMKASWSGDHIVYSTMQGTKVVERTPMAK